MTNKACLLLLLILATQISFAQTINCKVVDSNNTAIPYVNVYCPAIEYGINSDAKGRFSIDLEQLETSHSLRLTCIGFKDKLIQVKELKNQKSTKFLITMNEKTYNSPTVDISAENVRFVNKRKGIKTRSPIMQGGFYTSTDNVGEEFGTIIKNKGIAYLESIGINILTMTHDTMFYEVNIYALKGKTPTEPIIDQRIFLEITRESIKKTIIIDLKDRNLRIEGNFFVSLEAVQKPDDSKSYGITLAGKIFPMKRSVYKNYNGSWKVHPLSMSIFTNLRCVDN